jgi:hypothetical protein
MERDEWRCLICGLEDKTLHIHHLAYRNNAKPWDYPDEELVTLCEDCHLGVKNIKLTPEDIAFIRSMKHGKEIRELQLLVSGLSVAERQIIDGISPITIRLPVTKTRLEGQIETLIRANDWFRHK